MASFSLHNIRISTNSSSQQEILKFALDIVSGLQVLHEMKIMHRDLKSDNVFVLMNEKGDIDSLSGMYLLPTSPLL